ncbi:hypothetical protein C2857_005222 [Epichloe festucae Fl1]|uniref:RRM domain-containing protein n=1 Tax=Epichloe festucae (strain Fl1) TaxID=877507 RepID=A0A7S9PU26_EPIFF|nr:hypothetical protein C2857_005222 [Epichloe festucae Fl1]
MNKIKAIQDLNKKEIENGITPEGSWHVDYRDTAYIYFGGLPYEMTEGDVITIFSQFGEPTFLKLARDKETGKSKGFGWLQYEDQRSTDLAVDNLGGADVGGRIISVDHARYKARDDEDPAEFDVSWEAMMRKEGKLKPDDEQSEQGEVSQWPVLPEERELAILIRDHDEDDPMKAFLVEEKKKEVEEARRKAEKKEKIHRHGHGHRSHRRRNESPQDKDRRHRHRDRDRSKDRHRDRDPRSHRSDDSRDERRKERRHRGDDEDRERRKDTGRDRDDGRDPDRDRDRDRRRHGRDRSIGSGSKRWSGEDGRKRRSRSRSPRHHRD